MAKKLVKILVLSVLCICCAVGFAACSNNQGESGKSAYQIWLDNGSTGTQADFLNWLKGQDGNDGTNGRDGVDGKDGIDGKDGVDGKDGQNGVGVQSVTIDEDGNLIITLTNGNMTNAGKVLYNDENTQGLAFYLLPDGTYAVGCGTAYYLEEIVIPSTYQGKAVTQIVGFTKNKGGAFDDCHNLTSITIPDSVTSIGEHAFSDCDSLTSITIGNSVTSIGNEAFEYCRSLTSIVIPDSVTSIGDRAFYGCSSLTNLVIPDSVTSIGEWTFGYCSSLTSIVIPDSVTSIGGWAFSYCYSLTSVTIGNSVTSIGNNAFSYCSSLSSFMFNGLIEQWYAINKGVYWHFNVPTIVVKCINGEAEMGISSKSFALITLHDEYATYDKNFIEAFRAACAVKGVDGCEIHDISESDECGEAATYLAINGCKAVFANSFGHESYLIQTAKQFSNTRFFHATGVQAHTEDLNNYYNSFAHIYEGRYLTGYAAGLKLLTMKDKAVNNNFKIGYVDAFPYAECVSARTAFYLGVKAALNENDATYNVSMDVRYVGSWYDEYGEKSAAEALIYDGCVLISQYSDSMGAPNVCEEYCVPNVAYNYSTGKSTMVAYCKINWQPFFEKMIDCVLNGEEMPVDYCGDLNDDSVQWYLGGNAADGTFAKLMEIETELKNGTRKVFDCSTFTVNLDENTIQNAEIDAQGRLTYCLADVDEKDGMFIAETNVIITDSETGITYYAESYYRSAPYFDILIDGITVLNPMW